MRFQVAAFLFIVAAILLGWVASLSEALLAGLTALFGVFGLYLALLMGLRRYFYTSILLTVHIGLTIFASYIYLNRHDVVPEQAFVFLTFTDANLQIALSVLSAATLAIFVPWALLARRRMSILRLSPHAVAGEVLGRLDGLGLAWVQSFLAGSFVLGLLFFLTNTSVLEVSYPYQARTQWVPWEALKIPTLMTSIALAIAYTRRLSRGPGQKFLVLLARLNVLVTPALMLLLTGSRGLFTFLWLFIGLFELFLWMRRRGSLAWGLLFVGIAWFAFQSWPYMRWNLALLPLGDVLSEAVLIGLGLADESNTAAQYDQGIRLGDITMMGALLFHLLYVVQLIQDGVSLGGASFVNLIPQALPSWLDGVVWDRPIGDGWLLAEHYHHGGGFLVVANVYWNGGLWLATLFMGVLSAIFVGFDSHLANPRAGILYRAVYWLWLPVMAVQLGYGLQGLVRVIQLLAAVILVELLFPRVFVRRLRLHPGAR